MGTNLIQNLKSTLQSQNVRSVTCWTDCMLLPPNGGETNGWCILTLDIYLHV